MVVVLGPLISSHFALDPNMKGSSVVIPWLIKKFSKFYVVRKSINPYSTAFPYGNGMVLHFYQQQESSTTKTVHKVINKGLKTYV